MDAVNTVLFITAIVTDILLFVSFIMAIALGAATIGTRAGRIAFGSLTTLKLWVFLTLTYINLAPFIVQHLSSEVRVGIRTFLTVYLLLQAVGVIVALYRWRRN